MMKCKVDRYFHTYAADRYGLVLRAAHHLSFRVWSEAPPYPCCLRWNHRSKHTLQHLTIRCRWVHHLFTPHNVFQHRALFVRHMHRKPHVCLRTGNGFLLKREGVSSSCMQETIKHNKQRLRPFLFLIISAHKNRRNGKQYLVCITYYI